MKSKNAIASTNEHLAKAVFLGTVVGFSICAFLLILFSLILSRIGAQSDGVFTVFSFITNAATAFFAAYVSLKILKRQGLIFGAAVGFVLFLFFTILGFWLSREPFSLFTIAKFFIMIFMGAFGGIVGANR